MDRSEKEALVSSLNATFQEAGLVVITRNHGLTVAQANALRVKMRAAGAGYKVTKNRLVKLALKGTSFEGLSDQFTGPSAIASSVDPVAAAKATVEFAEKNEKLEIVGGGLGGQVLDANGVKALAKLPSLDELRSKFLGLLQAPATKVVGVVQAPGSLVARVLNAYAQKDAA